MNSIAAFSDTYLPTINGVTYTLTTWKNWWEIHGGKMTIIYPNSSHVHSSNECPIRSIPFPFYSGYRVPLPYSFNRSLLKTEIDLVHTHTPFSLGMAGQKLAKKENIPIVSSYHTPLSEYVQYISSNPFLSKQLSRIISNWECKFLDRSDMVLVHSNSAFSTLKSMGIKSPIKILKNGIDTSFFKPVDSADFLNRHGIDPDQTLIGYTGRHGYEKNIHELIQIATSIDATVLIAGDGPARQVLETQAKKTSPNILFIGRLHREELPEFYSALDLFIFPSPVETQGIVAIESISCGTPVVGSDQGALPETILQGVTGNHYQSGNKSSLLSSISTSLLNKTTLSDNCLNHRESISIDATISQLDSIYSSLLN